MKTSLLVLGLITLTSTMMAADKKIVFLAGRPSHGPGEHEHRAGCLLLQSCLDPIPGVSTVVITNGWPTDETVFDGAAAVVVYCDGGPDHPLLQDDRLDTMKALTDKGVGLACIHYGVEPTREKGQAEFIDWIGGCFEVYWSVNPTWTADFTVIPEHEVTRGVKPYALKDEWYFHMRFRENMEGVTPLLTAVPTPMTITRKDGPHENNPTVREEVEVGKPQVMAWVAEGEKGARGFGFTGGHYHRNWADDNTRKLVLNAILWIANVDVPPIGVVSTVTEEQLSENLDRKGAR